MSKEVRKAVAYFRISSRADRYSLKFQKAAVEAYAKTAGYDIGGTYYDAAVSGAEPIHKRSGFIEMLERLLGKHSPTPAERQRSYGVVHDKVFPRSPSSTQSWKCIRFVISSRWRRS
jgi:hypothetical protein